MTQSEFPHSGSRCCGSSDDTGPSVSDVVWSLKPAGEWAEGYPIGNGRLGAMILGDPLQERVGLNHDRLWRQYWTYQDHRTARDLPEVRRLCSEGKWDEAHSLILKKIPATGGGLYVNPFVPACDLGIYPFREEEAPRDYVRQLDMDAGVVDVSYTVGEIRYRREYLCSWPAGILAIRLSSDRAARQRGEITLSRLLDPDCTVTGSSDLGEVVLEGRFEEGVRFAVVTKVIQRGGRLTGGRATYRPPSGEMPPKDMNGIAFICRGKEQPIQPAGVSTCFDCADEVLVLTTICTEDETSGDMVGWCRDKLAGMPADFDSLRADHEKDHRSFYRRVQLHLGGASDGRRTPAPGSERDDSSGVEDPALLPTDELLARVCSALAASEGGVRGGSPDELASNNAGASAECRNPEAPTSDGPGSDEGPAHLVEKLFRMGRYLAIASGRPCRPDQPAKAPINLQGIWNQDRRPAWDCDYHLDLNVEMCYWSLEMIGLGDLLVPLMTWAEGLLPQGRHAAQDLYGCRGALLGGVNDLRNFGNVDDVCFWWTASGAWIGQVLWQHWEYERDISFLRERLYPFLHEIALFYQDYLVDDGGGRLVPFPSGSPEMGIKGRKRFSMVASPATGELELIRDTFSHLVTASDLLGIDEEDRKAWLGILDRLPLPVIGRDGCLQEWMEDHEPLDPGHRHRSHLIGVCPGDRITHEDTPEYSEAARLALKKRHAQGLGSSLSLSTVWDAQILARLHDADGAFEQLCYTIQTNVMDNLLMAISDWRDRGMGLSWFIDKKVFQIEAGIAIAGAIAEMIFQDRRGLLRLLPALPERFSDGCVRGLRGRGGFEVEIRWSAGLLERASIKSLLGNTCRVKAFRTRGELSIRCGLERVHTKIGDGIYEFPTRAGEVYELCAS